MLKNQILTVKECKNLTLKEIKILYNNHVNPGIVQSLNGFSFGHDLIAKSENFYEKENLTRILRIRSIYINNLS
jgi:hypothetical protein